MKTYTGHRRAPAMAKPERDFWAAVGRSLRSPARRRSLRDRLLRRL